MACGAIVDNAVTLQSVIQSCNQSSMFRENGRETLRFHKYYKAFVYDDCASHEAFLSLAKDIHALLYYCLGMNPLYEHSEYFLLNVLSSPDCR